MAESIEVARPSSLQQMAVRGAGSAPGKEGSRYRRRLADDARCRKMTLFEVCLSSLLLRALGFLSIASGGGSALPTSRTG